MKETIIGGDVDGLVKQNYNLKPLTLEEFEDWLHIFFNNGLPNK